MERGDKSNMKSQTVLQSSDLEEGRTDNILPYTNQMKYNLGVEPSKEENIGCFGCCGLCLGALLILGIIAGAIAYLVFGIMYLVEDYQIAKDCSGSNLWAYVLTAVILSFTRSGAKNSSNEEGGPVLCLLFCLGIIEGGLATWGGIELWQNSCSDLSDSNLWKFGLATFCIQVFCASLFLVIMPITFACLVKCK